MSLLFLLFFGFLMWVFLIKPILTLQKARQEIRDRFNQFTGQNGAQQQQRQRDEQSSGAATRSKKIDHNVGEYVEFTEVIDHTADGSTTRATESHRTVSGEPRVEDAEWVDE